MPPVDRPDPAAARGPAHRIPAAAAGASVCSRRAGLVPGRAGRWRTSSDGGQTGRGRQRRAGRMSQYPTPVYFTPRRAYELVAGSSSATVPWRILDALINNGAVDAVPRRGGGARSVLPQSDLLVDRRAGGNRWYAGSRRCGRGWARASGRRGRPRCDEPGRRRARPTTGPPASGDERRFDPITAGHAGGRTPLAANPARRAYQQSAGSGRPADAVMGVYPVQGRSMAARRGWGTIIGNLRPGFPVPWGV